MGPTELNAALTAITNHLYCNLTEKQFLNLAIFLSLLSKDMLSMEAIRDLCRWEESHAPIEKKQERKPEQKDAKPPADK